MQLQSLLDILPGLTTACSIALIVWATHRARKRAGSKKTLKELTQVAITKVKDEFASQSPIVDATFFRESYPPESSGKLTVWFITPTRIMEHDLYRNRELFDALDARTRTQLGLTGYLQEQNEKISVFIASKEMLDKYGWIFYAPRDYPGAPELPEDYQRVSDQVEAL